MALELRRRAKGMRRTLPAALRRRVDHPAQAALFAPAAGTEPVVWTWTGALQSLLAAGALAAFLALGMLAS